MTSAQPRRVVLSRGSRGFVLLVTYDCTVGKEGAGVAEVSLVAPQTTKLLSLSTAAFYYCTGFPPGQSVAIKSLHSVKRMPYAAAS